MWKNLCFVLTKKHQKMVSLNLPFLLNEATFEIYSYERVLQFRFAKVLWKESAKYFILCQIVDWLYTCRRKGIFLRILIKVILKHPRFVQNSTFQKSLADLHAGFQTDPTNSFWERLLILSKLATFEKWIVRSTYQHSLKQAPFTFHRRIWRPLFNFFSKKQVCVFFQWSKIVIFWSKTIQTVVL